jgi:hypothetical protein
VGTGELMNAEFTEAEYMDWLSSIQQEEEEEEPVQEITCSGGIEVMKPGVNDGE